MAVDIDDKKLDGKGLSDLWGIIKQYVAQHGSGVVPATEDTLGGIMVGSTLSITNAGVLNLPTLVTASTFRSVSVDAYGRVVGGTNPTTLAAYGITDAKIENGVITLGGNTITPITSLSGYATQSWVQQQGYTTNIGTVTQVKIGSTAYNPTSGVVSLPAYPTSLPASDVYSWAKASSKPSYTLDEVSDGSSRKLSNYLPLTGGTVNGVLTIAPTGISGYQDGIVLHDSGDGNGESLRIRFTSGSYTTGVCLSSNSEKTELMVNDVNTIYHTGNLTRVSQLTNDSGYITSSALSSYLPLSGGTVTGEIHTSATSGTYKFICTAYDEYFDSRMNLHLGEETGDFNIFKDSSYDASSNLLCIKKSSGNVGIGTASPSYKLHVNGSVYVTGTLTVPTGGGLVIGNRGGDDGNSPSRIIQAYRTDRSASYINFGHDASSGNCGEICYEYNSNGSSSNCLGAGFFGARVLTITYGGNVGIGTTSPSYKLDINGSVGATSYNNTSDVRKKRIIENLSIDIYNIANAPIFKFYWIDQNMPNGINVGTSAQYWKTIIPEIVTEANDNDRTLSMQYSVAGLVSSITLARKVVEQDNIIKLQDTRIKALEDAITEIENTLYSN